MRTRESVGEIFFFSFFFIVFDNQYSVRGLCYNVKDELQEMYNNGFDIIEN